MPRNTTDNDTLALMATLIYAAKVHAWHNPPLARPVTQQMAHDSVEEAVNIWNLVAKSSKQ